MAPHGKELSEDLRIKDGRGYKKISNNLKLSYSTVARVIQRFSKIRVNQILLRPQAREGRNKNGTHKKVQIIYRIY